MEKKASSAILVFAKAPVKGQVKTRLASLLGYAGAARLYRRLLWRQMEWLCSAQLGDIQLWCSPDETHEEFQRIKLHYPLTLHQQKGEDLGARMQYAATQALGEYANILIIGVDCPVLDAGHLSRALSFLEAGDEAVICPAEDGGYVLLGLNQMAECLFNGLPWGTDQVSRLTRQCLRQLGWQWRELPMLWDLDRPEDLQRLENWPDSSRESGFRLFPESLTDDEY
jgi:rSAM/selenodomain-associated transferase 1